MVSKPLLIAGIGTIAVVGFGLYKGTSIKETADNIKVSLASLPKIHKMDLSGMKISVDLKVDNPGKERVTVKITSVRLYYKGKQVASTKISDKLYTIEPVSTGKITGIIIETSYLTLLFSAPSLYNDFKTQNTSIAKNFGFDAIVEVNGVPLKVQKIA